MCFRPAAWWYNRMLQYSLYLQLKHCLRKIAHKFQKFPALEGLHQSQILRLSNNQTRVEIHKNQVLTPKDSGSGYQNFRNNLLLKMALNNWERNRPQYSYCLVTMRSNLSLPNHSLEQAIHTIHLHRCTRHMTDLK